MEFTHVVKNLSQDVIEKLNTAIEIGRWENGEKLSAQQIEVAMQAVMYWQAKHNSSPDLEPFVVGSKGELFTGKGESHKVVSVKKIDEPDIIYKQKV